MSDIQRPWLEEYPDSLDAHKRKSYDSIAEVIYEACQVYPAHTAFIDGDRKISFKDFSHSALSFAGFLKKLGLSDQEAVAIFLPNCLEFVISAAAMSYGGYAQVCINPNYTSIELKHQITDSGARYLVTHIDKEQHWKPLIEEGLIDYVFIVGGENSQSGRSSFEFALREGAGLMSKPAEGKPDDIALLQYTGGTTGVSKGAVLTNSNMVSNQRQVDPFLENALQKGCERILTALPLYHILAYSVNYLLIMRYGGTSILIRDPRDQATLFQAIETHKPTCVTGVNTLFAGLLQAKDQLDISSIRFALGGGSAIQDTTQAQWKACCGSNILEGYGLSETSPVVTLNPVWRGSFKPGIGLPLPETDVAIMDDDGQFLPQGQEGELCVRGPQVMRGYWNMPEETKKVFYPGGWFRTGDIAFMEPDGQFVICDRKKDMVIVSGFNVYPNEVEAVAASHEAVTECACVGKTDDKSGEALVLFVVSNGSLDVKELQAHCRERLAAYKTPKDIRVVEGLPKTPVGKILRSELRKQV